MSSTCEYCRAEGGTPEEAVLCETHFNNTMVMAQQQIDCLREQVAALRRELAACCCSAKEPSWKQAWDSYTCKEAEGKVSDGGS